MLGGPEDLCMPDSLAYINLLNVTNDIYNCTVILTENMWVSILVGEDVFVEEECDATEDIPEG